MKKYVKFAKQKILIVNKKYKVGRLYNPRDILYDVKVGFEKMQKDALKENIFLLIVSGYRSYSYQRNIYNKYKLSDSLVDTYSAKPGHSEHQTGLAVDICNAESKNILKFKKEYKWLNDNAYKYGFILRYPNGKEAITKYKHEPWHYRYVGNVLARELYNNGNWLTLEERFCLKS